jgi:hypothetical protein
MKKIAIILVVLLLICGMSALSFAQTSQTTTAKKAEVSTEVIKGKIISIDTARNEIVLKENKTGTEKTISVAPAVISSLKVGEEVKVTLKAGSNVAEKVKEITEAKKTSK